MIFVERYYDKKFNCDSMNFSQLMGQETKDKIRFAVADLGGVLGTSTPLTSLTFSSSCSFREKGTYLFLTREVAF